jgi:hypothetical protein
MTTETTTLLDAMRANIPAELQQLAQCVTWKFEQRSDEKKPTKVLYNPATGARADSTEPRTWGTFVEAGATYERGGFDGLGFVVTDDDPYVGVDLDGCIVNGELTDDANRWVLLLNSYTELTPSGVGVRVWIRGKKPGARCKNAKLGVEIYETNRFFTVTGNRLLDMPTTINDRQTELEALYNEVFPPTDKPANDTQSEPSGAVLSMDDRQLVDLMCRDHDIKNLFDGDLSAHSNDHSAADLALCNHLAFWTGKDADRMNRIFKTSGLYRKKWDRADYSKNTISRAIAGCKNTYDPENYRSNNNMGNPSALVGNGATPAASATGAGAQQSGATGQATATPLPAGSGQPTGAAGNAKPGKTPSGNTANILQALDQAGYAFRMNELDDSIEVNGEIINDGVASEIRCTMRDKGFNGMEALKDAYTMNAYHNRYHPIRNFLDGLVHDGNDHIANLAAHFTDSNGPIRYSDGSTSTVIHAFLKRWLIGAVAKVYAHGQNITLTFAGKQGIGKSFVASWLCSPLTDYFNEGQLDPDGKETDRRLAKTWIWEIGELGATTRRADVNALKNKLTQTHVTFRIPYGHYDVTKPVLTSFIGTVNPDGRGFLVDKTGNRRFAVVDIESIDFTYTAIDPRQVWAQAMALYHAGEPWRLTAEETATQNFINDAHQTEETIDMVMPQLFYIDPADDTLQISPMAIAQELLFKNYAKDLDKCSKDAAAWLKNNGHTKKGKPPTWRGIRLRKPGDPQ